MTSSQPEPSARARFGSKLLVAILVGLFVLSVAGFVGAVINAGSRPAASPSPTTDAAAVPSTDRFRLALADVSPAPSEPRSSLSPPAVIDPADSAADASIAIVPVTGFWSRKEGIARRDIQAALETGQAEGYKQVSVERTIADALAASFDIELHADVHVRKRKRVEATVAKGGLGFLSASDVSPRVRALKVNGDSLFGNDRITSLDDWSLLVQPLEPTPDDADVPESVASPPVAPDPAAEPAQDAVAVFDPAGTWVLVAGGDSFTDRGVYDNVVRKGRGIDFPFDGGTARVTGHGCCDPVFDDNIVPRYELTGEKGIVRKLFRSAELAIANHEAPVTEGWAFHRKGFRFSGKPELTRIFTRAGIDWVSLANNHIKDYGTDGIKDTRRILRKFGLAFSGAGEDLDQARKIKPLEINGTKVAIIPCVGVARAAWAGPETSGGTPCLDQYIVKDIRKAKRTNDVVIVFPHWGVEYTRQPLPSMRKQAERWVKVGADLVLGAHSHVAGAIEDFDGVPVLYSLGNLVFDQHWSTNTMESFILEATFNGDQLVQMRLHPYIVHAQSQPNLLDPKKGEGRRLLKEVKAASRSGLDW
jgi:hypothetical protein